VIVQATRDSVSAGLRTAHPYDHQRPRWPWLLGGVAAIAGLFGIRSLSASAAIPLSNQLQDLLTLSISVIIESMPFVILGVLLSIAVQVWFPETWFRRFMPRSPGARRLVISLLGVLLPVCECGNVPLARGLMVRGFSVSESATFLLAAPIINPITILTTYQAFGFGPILIGRVVGGLVIANGIGWLLARHPHQDSLLQPRFAAMCRAAPNDVHMHSRIAESFRLFAREASVITPALFAGALIAGAIQSLVPRSLLVALGSDPVWSIIALVLLAFVVSVCSNVDAFFILPFATTFLPGSIVAFLVFGPVIDIKMLALMRTTYTGRTLALLALFVGLLTLVIALVVNLVA
jgi:uncharacterized protein